GFPDLPPGTRFSPDYPGQFSSMILMHLRLRPELWARVSAPQQALISNMLTTIFSLCPSRASGADPYTDQGSASENHMAMLRIYCMVTSYMLGEMGNYTL